MMTLKRRLSLYTIILTLTFVTVTTAIYYFISLEFLKRELSSQGRLIISENITVLETYFQNTRAIAHSVGSNQDLVKFLLNPTPSLKDRIESEFLNIYKKVPLVQAIRLVDSTGKIRVFVKEGKILSRIARYKNINLKSKTFFQQAIAYPGRDVIFSNMERGKLPVEKSFCPSMVRAILPLYHNDQRLGFLVLNIWGNKIGEAINGQEDAGRKRSFLVEVNRRDKKRNGIFLYHWNEKYEFANQFHTDYTFPKIYGEKLWSTLVSRPSGVLKLRNGDVLFFDTFSPYNDSLRYWKVCSILNHRYFYGSIMMIKRSYFVILFISLVLVVFLSNRISDSFTKPISHIVEKLEFIGKGNLEAQVDVKGDYELQVISSSINNMTRSLKKYIEELHESRKKLELMDRLSSLGTLSAGIAHELSTPLNSIIILSDLLSSSLHGKDREEALTIKNQAERCVRIIQGLREFSSRKIDDKSTEPISLSSVVRTLVPMIELYTHKKTVEYHLEEGCYILGNRVQIEQLIINLVLNSADAVSDIKGGKIVIKVESSGSNCKIIVEDNGPGIPEDVKNRIFDPFFTTKADGEGTGLGLSIVHGIVKSHGGKIEVNSTPGKGTRFVVSFPGVERKNHENNVD